MLLRDIVKLDHAWSTLDRGDVEITGIATDSRRVLPGFVFAAIPGNTLDGLDYALTAIDAGAVAIIASRNADQDKLKNISAKVSVILCDDVRDAVVKIARVFYPKKPELRVAVTGTNGKSSTVTMLRQLWYMMGRPAASLGTLGLKVDGIDGFDKTSALTTPDSITMQQYLNDLAIAGVDAIACETSSHGLDQRRSDGLQPNIAIFTNLTQDHLDYHGSMENYFQAKLRLFTELLAKDGTAIINTDDDYGLQIIETVKSRGIKYITYGSKGSEDITLTAVAPSGDGQSIDISVLGQSMNFYLPFPGEFQAFNLMAVLGCIVATFGKLDENMAQFISQLKPIPGRMAPVASGVFVDYAHTPDALALALSELAKRGRTWVVFGCGGDRDPDKRPIMGRVAARYCAFENIIITDDNPRSEDPSLIRRQILAAASGAIEIADRRHAIEYALSNRGNGDLILIAGKGHENYQILKDKTIDFDDGEVVREYMTLWNSEELGDALQLKDLKDFSINGISIDTRTLDRDDLFVALQGESSDGHDYVEQAFAKGAGAALVSKSSNHENLLLVNDTLKGLETLGVYARDRAVNAKRIAVTGSMGKTTTKEMMGLMLGAQAMTHISQSSYNNHWGVPLTLARMPRGTKYGVFEIGMNHGGEITPLTRMVKPHVAIITNVAESHIGFFKSLDDIAHAKAEIFKGLEPGGHVILNNDNEKFELLSKIAKEEGVQNTVTFGESDGCFGKLCRNGGGKISAFIIDGVLYDNLPNLPGEHFYFNALAGLVAIKLVGGDVEKSLIALSDFKAIPGRGLQVEMKSPKGIFRLHDESYNANPKAIMAALKVLGESKCQGKKIAVLGDMRELGDFSKDLHMGLKESILQNRVDRVICCGPYMEYLYDTLPDAVKVGYGKTSADVVDFLKQEIEEGDIVLVKGSLGTKMKVIIDALSHWGDDNKKVALG